MASGNDQSTNERVSARLQEKNYPKDNQEDTHILLYYPDECSYAILDHKSSTKHLNKGRKLGDEFLISHKGRKYTAIIKFIGSLHGCKDEENKLEKDIRRDNGESSICSGADVQSLDSPTFDRKSKNKAVKSPVKRKRIIDFSSEDEEAAPPAPSFDFHRQVSAGIPGGSLINVQSLTPTSKSHRNSTPVERAVCNESGSGAPRSRNTCSVDRLIPYLVSINQTMSQIKDVLVEQQRAVPPQPPQLPQEPVNEEDFILDGVNFLQYQKVKRPTKMAILLAKHIWQDDLKKGIIEPGRSIKSNVQILCGERLALLKRLLKHHYGEKYTSNLWRSCRESVNQCARDMRRSAAAAAVPEDEDEEDVII